MAKRRLSKQQSRRIASKALDLKALVDHREDMRKGLVVTQYGRRADVEDVASGTVVRCKQRANLPPVVAGDLVIWSGQLEDTAPEFNELNKVPGRDQEESITQLKVTRAVVESLFERKSVIQRPDKFGKLRTLAANVDLMFVTVAAKPEPHFNFIDRYLVAAFHCGVAPHIVINKAELLGAESDEHADSAIRERLDQVREFYPSVDIPVSVVSAKTGQGLDELGALIQNQSAVFVGQSGVGKSSLIKSLLLEEQDLLGDLADEAAGPEKQATEDIDQIEIGDLSHARDKGRHTTTYSKVYKLINNGLCIDSPGIREFGLWHLSEEDIIRAFPDIAEISVHCRFRNCRHEKEPGCAIRDKVGNDPFFASRYQSYRAILSSLDDYTVHD